MRSLWEAFNKRYVNSHKRLAHEKRRNPGLSELSEPEMMKEILSLYGRLSDDKRKELQTQLESRTSAKQ